ncbi:hypothetical protein ASPBRDRAFT_212095 [Aspergillus brasiliensis CBS 101740]|uniref:Uncharacterized protein n=1 Tax=Aspergillus brasiliensis (strain CBS 101740 / IMI 381727 / IBT 21946) TaxID=767769 RepID=A0A1L9U1A1_ASPBC|nr:hypothetical protein ASPBRDRAFT_212095 [Aspergillus brasiliensis CBS 101740]
MPDAYGTIVPSRQGGYYRGNFQVNGTPYSLDLQLNTTSEFSCSNAKLTYDSVNQLAGSKGINDGHVKDDDMEIKIDAGSGKQATITGSLDYPVAGATLIGQGTWSHYVDWDSD